MDAPVEEEKPIVDEVDKLPTTTANTDDETEPEIKEEIKEETKETPSETETTKLENDNTSTEETQEPRNLRKRKLGV